MRIRDDSLIVHKGEWRYSSLTNNWGLLLDRYIYHIDCTIMIKFESNLCVYYGNDRRAIFRAVAAFLLRKAIAKRIQREERFEQYVREKVELITYYGRRWNINLGRLDNCFRQFRISSEQMGNIFDYLLTSSRPRQ